MGCIDDGLKNVEYGCRDKESMFARKLTKPLAGLLTPSLSVDIQSVLVEAAFDLVGN